MISRTYRSVQVHEGVTLRFYPSTIEPIRIRIGETTAQDLLCDLGPPADIHYREDDRMTIHSKSRKEDEEIDTGCKHPRVIESVRPVTMSQTSTTTSHTELIS